MGELLSILSGYCTIQLWRNISGKNFYPVFKIVGNVLVDGKNFCVLNKDRWLMEEDYKNQSYYAKRIEHQGIKTINIYMAREILGLPRSKGNSGDVADHKTHDTRDNTEENLRVATPVQSVVNRIKWGSRNRFKGISKNKSKYHAHIKNNGSNVYFPSVPTDIEAGLMYHYAGIILHDKFCYVDGLPSEEVPSRESRWELMGMVVDKLRYEGII